MSFFSVLIIVAIILIISNKKNNDNPNVEQTYDGLIGVMISNASSIFFAIFIIYTAYCMIYEQNFGDSSDNGAGWVFLMFLLFVVPTQIITLIIGTNSQKNYEKYIETNKPSKFRKFNSFIFEKLFYINFVLSVLFVLCIIFGIIK